MVFLRSIILTREEESRPEAAFGVLPYAAPVHPCALAVPTVPDNFRHSTPYPARSTTVRFRYAPVG